ncbi:MAG: fasciclin domain-containing protein [Pyrinomonadaceae bacterium]|nr:fasciclin domain-containing protein [Pyrinomonadaceae bacterium]
MKTILWTLVLTLSVALSVSAQKTTSRGDAPFAPPPSVGNLVEVALEVNGSGPFAGQFDTLIAAVLAADPVIVEKLTKKGKLTVFAPTDDAFAALGINPGNVGDLDQGFLTQVLAYHVVPGERLAVDVIQTSRFRSIQGTFFFQEGGVLTDAVGRTSNIIVTDVMADNGVIHAIDAVILPFAPSAIK